MELILIIIVGVLMFSVSNRVGELEKEVKRLKQGSAVKSSFIPPPTASAPSPNTVDVWDAPPAPVPTPASMPASTAPIATERPTEFAIGSRWFLVAGALAVLLGIGFFFRYAFENNLISEPLRVLLGGAVGVVFIGLGLWLKERFRTYGLSLVGVGLGALYISFYSAYALYSLFPPMVSFGFVVAVVLLGIGLSFVFDTKQLAVFSLAGGYIGVFLFIEHLSLAGGFASLFLLSLLVVAVSYFKRWPELVTIGFLFSVLSLMLWHGADGEPLTLILPLISLLFGVYAVSTLCNFVRSDDTYSSWQSFNVYGIPTAFFLYAQQFVDDPASKGLLALGIAAFYALLGLGARAFAENHIALRKFFDAAMFLVPAFVALGVGLYFEGNTRVLLLAIEGALVTASGLRFNNVVQYLLGQALLAAGVLMAWLYAMLTHVGTAPIVFNEVTFTLAVVTFALGAAWFAHLTIHSTIKEGPQKELQSIDALAMYFMAFATVFYELSRLHMGFTDTLAAASAAGAVVTLVAYLLGYLAHEKPLRYASYAGLVVATIGVVFASVMAGSGVTLLANLHVTGMAAVVILAGLMYATLRRATDAELQTEFGNVRYALLVAANAAVLGVLTMEIHRYFHDVLRVDAASMSRISISLFWLFYAIIGLVIGIARRSTFSRQLAIVLFAVTALKVFLFDSLTLPDLYRFVSFIALGVILLVVGFLYYRYKDRIHSFVGIGQAVPPPQAQS